MEENTLTKRASRYTYREHFPSFDILRVVCMAMIIFIEFGLYFIPYFSYAQPILNFAVGTLFTVYGFLVLRDGANLNKNIAHAFIAFLILLVIYGGLTAGYYWLTTGDPWAGISKRALFNFVVLNYWGTPFCASIWYVQSTLYALIIFRIFRWLKKIDWLVCIVLFAVAILIGELAHIINFSFLGNSYIPGNFLTRTIPYMLLGRLIYNHYDGFTSKMRLGPWFYAILGFVLAIGEYLALGFTNNLIYANHFAGFILVAMSLCIYCAEEPDGGILAIIGPCASIMYKGMYYTYNPLGYISLIAASFLCQTESQYYTCQKYLGLAVAGVTMLIFWFVGYLKLRRNFYKNLGGQE